MIKAEAKSKNNVKLSIVEVRVVSIQNQTKETQQ